MSTNVLATNFSMNSFSYSTLPVSDFACNQINQSTLCTEEHNTMQLILGIVVFCIGAAIFIAPEKPQQFASICEKYNTVHACQIW